MQRESAGKNGFLGLSAEGTVEPGPKRGGCPNTREGRDAGPEAIGRHCRPTGEYELDSGSCGGGAWCHPMWGSVSTLKTGVRDSLK